MLQNFLNIGRVLASVVGLPTLALGLSITGSEQGATATTTTPQRTLATRSGVVQAPGQTSGQPIRIQWGTPQPTPEPTPVATPEPEILCLIATVEGQEKSTCWEVQQ